MSIYTLTKMELDNIKNWETAAVLSDGHVFKLIPTDEQTDKNAVCLIRQKHNGEWVNRGNFASVKDGLAKIS